MCAREFTHTYIYMSANSSFFELLNFKFNLKFTVVGAAFPCRRGYICHSCIFRTSLSSSFNACSSQLTEKYSIFNSGRIFIQIVGKYDFFLTNGRKSARLYQIALPDRTQSS